MKKHKIAAAAITAALLVSGCATATKGSYSGSIADDQVTEGTAGASGNAVTESPSLTFQQDALVEDSRQSPDSLLSKRIIYFDYDKSVVREEAFSILSAHADFTLKNRSIGIILEGHADERGSNEYNLALGQRRADAVRDLLASYGVSPAQMESLSLGEERPRATGSNEAAWQENRRVEIRYTDE